jgi:CheY-like chemotaxis protein
VPCTLLAIDDNPQVLDLISESLVPLGSTVLESRTGLQALELAEERGQEIDVVLTDLHLGDVSGREMALVLRQYRPFLPVGFTANPGVEEPFTRLSLLSKPFTSTALQHFVDRLLGHRRPSTDGLAALWTQAAEVIEQSRRLHDAVRTARQARWALLAQTGQLRAAARELRIR